MSERRRQPDYDFFAPPRGSGPSGAPSGSFPASGPFGGGPPAPAGSPFGSLPPGPAPARTPAHQPFPTAPVPRYGGPSAVGGSVPGASGPVPAGVAWTTPQTSRFAPTRRLAAAALAVAALTAGAVWGVPAYRDHRAQVRWEHTQVTLPASFAGTKGISSPALERLMSGDLGGLDSSFDKPQVLAYRTSRGLVVAVGTKSPTRLTGEEIDEGVKLFEGEVVKAGGRPSHLTPPKGATTLSCAGVRAGGTTCVAISDSALVVAIVQGSTDAAALTRQLWQESVHD